MLLAKRAATVSQFAAGRTVLGLGAGWQVNEHRAYGFDLPEAGPRVDRFAEALELVHTLVRSDRTTYRGHYYQLDDAPFAPKPVGEMPLLVGTASPRMQRLTARWADEWNTWGDPTEVRRRTDLFLAACDAVGLGTCPISVIRDHAARIGEEHIRFGFVSAVDDGGLSGHVGHCGITYKRTRREVGQARSQPNC